jgi:hypothetical protein
MRLAAAVLAPALTMTFAGCGYHAGGHAALVPKTVRTIAIPAFGNATTRYKLAEHLPADIGREFIARTRYHVVADPAQADAVLNGAVLTFGSYPSVADPTTGRATGIQVAVVLQFKLTERATGRVLVNRPAVEVRERYEISIDPKAYFDESETALQRLSQDVARQVVSTVLESF